MSVSKVRSAGICKVVAVAATLAAFSMGVGCEGNDNTVNGVGGEEGGDAGIVLGEGEVGTLLAFYNSFGPQGVRAFQDETHLNSYLDSTHYESAIGRGDVIQEITHQPDFNKWTYFAISELDYPRTFNVSYGDDAVTVNYVVYSICDSDPGIRCAPPANKVVVYFIPFTGKEITFEKTRALQSDYFD